MLQDLALKTLYFEGSVSAETIAERMALPLDPTIGILDSVRKERLCEILGGDTASVGGYRYALTDSGLARVMSALERSGYAGPVPVPLPVYIDSVRRQSIYDVTISRDAVEQCLAHLVLDQQTVDRIGQALSSERAMLLYGDTGNGKTTVAQALRGVLPGYMFIPYAVEVMHQVIQLFDPSSFEVIAHTQPAHAATLDRRWVKVRRPVVFAAGELAANQLELVRDEVSQTYEAPIQMKANGGILVIDDFGRQRLDAAYLLNRWIVPLEHHIDHLSLANGARFQVPYDVIPLFISNLRPAELVDEAFLRRIRYKIEIPNPTAEAFNVILRHECSRVGVAYDDSAAHYLVERYFLKAGRTMRGCHPRDIVESIADAANYRETDPVLSVNAIDDACHTYFV
jgi:predicted ATPase with chaperone activity